MLEIQLNQLLRILYGFYVNQEMSRYLHFYMQLGKPWKLKNRFWFLSFPNILTFLKLHAKPGYEMSDPQLSVGQTIHLTFTFYAHQLAFYQEDMRYAVSPGEVEVMIGSSSEDIRLTGTFTISGDSTQVVEKKIFFSDVTVSE
jgi:hypothetical protein